jgi:hypothetical protein
VNQAAHFFLITIVAPDGVESLQMSVYIADRPLHENAVLAASKAVTARMQEEGYAIKELWRIDFLEPIRVRRSTTPVWELEP